ncbi:MAG: hypothetical protein QXX29_02625 [Nitrososphaerota archaeon]
MWDGGASWEAGDVRGIIRAIFESILGRSCFTALSYHLGRSLGEDPLTAFLRRPRDFYRALAAFFGENGAMVTFKIICGRLIVLSGSEDLTPDEVYDLLMRDENAARRVIMEMLERMAREKSIST